jgi:large subunit ribosomal protein L13
MGSSARRAASFRMKTYAPKPTDVERRWYVVDADGVVLGRLASEVAKILRGKHKPIYAPHADVGDHVVVVNARGIRLTGGKENKKIAYRHSGYPGGLTETVYADLLEKRPRFVVEKAVKGMLPKSRLGRAMASKLQVYDGPEHPHQAQKPEPLALGTVPPWNGLPVREPKEAPEPKRAAAPARTGRAAPAKPAAKTSTSKRSAAKPAAKTSTAKRSTAKTSTAKKSTAKKSAAKRSTTRRRKTAKEE